MKYQKKCVLDPGTGVQRLGHEKMQGVVEDINKSGMVTL